MNIRTKCIASGKKIQKSPLTNYEGNEEITLSSRDRKTQEILEGQSLLKLLQKEIEDQLKSKLVDPNVHWNI